MLPIHERGLRGDRLLGLAVDVRAVLPDASVVYGCAVVAVYTVDTVDGAKFRLVVRTPAASSWTASS